MTIIFYNFVCCSFKPIWAVIKTFDWLLANIYLALLIILKLNNNLIQLICEVTTICVTLLHSVNRIESLANVNYNMIQNI